MPCPASRHHASPRTIVPVVKAGERGWAASLSRLDYRPGAIAVAPLLFAHKKMLITPTVRPGTAVLQEMHRHRPQLWV